MPVVIVVGDKARAVVQVGHRPIGAGDKQVPLRLVVAADGARLCVHHQHARLPLVRPVLQPLVAALRSGLLHRLQHRHLARVRPVGDSRPVLVGADGLARPGVEPVVGLGAGAAPVLELVVIGRGADAVGGRGAVARPVEGADPPAARVGVVRVAARRVVLVAEVGVILDGRVGGSEGRERLRRQVVLEAVEARAVEHHAQRREVGRHRGVAVVVAVEHDAVAIARDRRLEVAGLGAEGERVRAVYRVRGVGVVGVLRLADEGRDAAVDARVLHVVDPPTVVGPVRRVAAERVAEDLGDAGRGVSARDLRDRPVLRAARGVGGRGAARHLGDVAPDVGVGDERSGPLVGGVGVVEPDRVAGAVLVDVGAGGPLVRVEREGLGPHEPGLVLL